jgi:hypothetical protein
MAGQLSELITKENAPAKIAHYFNLPPSLPSESWRELDDGSGGKIFETSWQNPDGSVDTRSIRISSNRLEGYYIDIIIAACRLFKDSPLYSRATCWDLG